MKVIICITLIIISVAAGVENPRGYTSTDVNSQNNRELDTNKQSAQDAQQSSDTSRNRNYVSYGAATHIGGGIPAPICPKNYLFSCQPNLVPVPCAGHYHGHAHYHGHVVDYSAPVPIQKLYKY